MTWVESLLFGPSPSTQKPINREELHQQRTERDLSFLKTIFTSDLLSSEDFFKNREIEHHESLKYSHKELLEHLSRPGAAPEKYKILLFRYYWKQAAAPRERVTSYEMYRTSHYYSVFDSGRIGFINEHNDLSILLPDNRIEKSYHSIDFFPEEGFFNRQEEVFYCHKNSSYPHKEKLFYKVENNVPPIPIKSLPESSNHRIFRTLSSYQKFSSTSLLVDDLLDEKGNKLNHPSIYIPLGRYAIVGNTLNPYENNNPIFVKLLLYHDDESDPICLLEPRVLLKSIDYNFQCDTLTYSAYNNIRSLHHFIVRRNIASFLSQPLDRHFLHIAQALYDEKYPEDEDEEDEGFRLVRPEMSEWWKSQMQDLDKR
jgi:hypothetical protein